jgi:two-component system response regulator TctD
MRLLLVEDTEDLAEALLKHLRQCDHTVDHAGSLRAAEGFWSTERDSYDVIVLDIELPDGEGTTLLKQVRASGLPVGILVLTARSEVEDKVYLLDVGADDYLTKPFALDELDARLRAVKRRHLSRPLVTQTIGPLSYDPTNRTVWIGSDQLQLRSQELKLFESMIESTGWSASKEYLFDRLYGLDQEASANAIEVHVSRLRRKLIEHGLEVEAVRGYGYRLRYRADE